MAAITTQTNGQNGANDQHAEVATPDVTALLTRIQDLEQRVAGLEAAPAQDIEDRATMVVFSGDLDKAIASFIIATGAAAMGLEVSMFFTFWGLNVVKKGKKFNDKNILAKGFTALMPGGSQELTLSQMNYFGVGAKLIRKVMKDHEVSSLEDFIQMSQEFGVRMIACDMSKELLGVADDELIDGLELGGVAAFIGDAARSKVTLFV